MGPKVKLSHCECDFLSWCSIESSSQFRKIDYRSNRPTYKFSTLRMPNGPSFYKFLIISNENNCCQYYCLQ